MPQQTRSKLPPLTCIDTINLLHAAIYELYIMYVRTSDSIPASTSAYNPLIRFLTPTLTLTVALTNPNPSPGTNRL